MRSELVDLDLAKFTDVADSLALEGSEIGGNSRILQIDDSGEGFVEETSNRNNGEVASFSLWYVSRCIGYVDVPGSIQPRYES